MWMSERLYQHPVNGQCGRVEYTDAGIYCFRQGNCRMSLPQEFGAEVEFGERQNSAAREVA